MLEFSNINVVFYLGSAEQNGALSSEVRNTTKQQGDQAVIAEYFVISVPWQNTQSALFFFPFLSKFLTCRNVPIWNVPWWTTAGRAHFTMDGENLCLKVIAEWLIDILVSCHFLKAWGWDHGSSLLIIIITDLNYFCPFHHSCNLTENQ